MTSQELRERFEQGLRAAADREKIYIHFDLRTDGSYKEPAIRLSYAAFLDGVSFITDGALQRVGN